MWFFACLFTGLLHHTRNNQQYDRSPSPSPASARTGRKIEFQLSVFLAGARHGNIKTARTAKFQNFIRNPALIGFEMTSGLFVGGVDDWIFHGVSRPVE
jgi:hypothetical protein